MARSIKSCWREIEQALSGAAPDLCGCLRPGASAQALDALERALGRRLPTPLRSSLGLHDGSSEALFDAERLLGCSEIAKVHAMRCEVAGWLAQDDAAHARRWWRSELIPFTESEGDGLCVEARRPYAVYYHVHDGTLRKAATSFGAWLSTLASQLSRGAFELEDGGLWLRSPASVLGRRRGAR